MRVMLMMRKVEMLLHHFGLGCMGAIVIHPTRVTGVFPRPPYPLPHVRRVFSLLSFFAPSISAVNGSAVSVSAVKVYPEPDRTEPEGMSYIMRRAPVSFQHAQGFSFRLNLILMCKS